MVEVIATQGFKKGFKKLNSMLKQKVLKHIEKLTKNPLAGKPLKYKLKGERTIYIPPYRLIYATEEDKIILLRILHRKKVYK